MARRQRYDHARELRVFAAHVDALPTATRLSTDESVIAKMDLAKRMRARADELVRTEDPIAEGVFMTGAGRSAGGTPFQAERKARTVRAVL